MLLHADSQQGSEMAAALGPLIAQRRDADIDMSVDGTKRPRVLRWSDDPDQREQLKFMAEAFGSSEQSAFVLGDEQWRALDVVDRVTNRVSVNHSFYEGNAAGTISVPVVGGDGSISASSATLVQDTYRAYVDETTIGGARIYYGGAVRLAVTILEWNANFKLSFPFLAAKVDTNEVRATYRFEVLGLRDCSVIAGHLPRVGEFTSAAYLGLLESTHECAKLLLTSELEPVRLFIETDAKQVSSVAYTYLHALRAVISSGGDDRPAVDRNPDVYDIQDWVIDSVWHDARQAADPKQWAKQKFERLMTTFCPPKS